HHFPRSLRYCLKAAQKLLTDIWPQAAAGGIGGLSYGRTGALADWLDGREATFATGSLHAMLTHVVDETSKICSHVGEEMLGPPRPAPGKAVTRQSQTQIRFDEPPAVKAGRA